MGIRPGKPQRFAHTLKGVSGNIGAMELRTTVRDFEVFLKDNFADEKAIETQLSSVTALLNPMIAEILEFENKRKKEEITKASEELDIEKVKPVLEELKSNLDQYSTQSSESLDKLKEILSGHGHDMELMKLEKHINGYDFDSALEVLGKIMEKMKE